jgi:hypothetical protein
VRVAAVYAFTQITKKGSGATAELANLLEDADAAVRFAAVKAVPQISEKGNPAAIVALAARLEDMHGSVRDAAEEALMRVAAGNRSDSAVISALASIAHIKDNLTASLQFTHEPSGGEGEEDEEILLATAALMRAAKRQLLVQSHLTGDDEERDGSRSVVTREGYLFTEGGRARGKARKADGPRVGRKWERGSGPRIEDSFYTLFISKGMLHALITFVVILWIVTKAIFRAYQEFGGPTAREKNGLHGTEYITG